MIRRVCIASCTPPGWSQFEMGDFVVRDGAAALGLPEPIGTKVKLIGDRAIEFAKQFDCVLTWNPMDSDVANKISRPGKTRIGIALAVENISNKPHGDPILDALRNALLPLTYQPPIDANWQAPASSWHSMAVDFEHRSKDVIAVVQQFLLTHIRPLNLGCVFFDCLQAQRYWANNPNVPPDVANGQMDSNYDGTWNAIVDFCQRHVAPVWGHNSGVGPNPPAAGARHLYRVEEHFYRTATNTWPQQQSNANAFGQVLIRSGEWVDLQPKLAMARAELLKPAGGGDAWVVSARSGGAFGCWS